MRRSFRRRAVELARSGDRSVSALAKSLGISQSCLSNWMRQADIEEGRVEGLTAADLRSGSDCAGWSSLRGDDGRGRCPIDAGGRLGCVRAVQPAFDGMAVQFGKPPEDQPGSERDGGQGRDVAATADFLFPVHRLVALRGSSASVATA
ncbi:hypothetical protein EBO15_31115 [Actinomadura harenae]|uniref:Helix-turn-helix domain-containing protein n=1 Tax=Actinomadura harenae TaxID=2483351 RepID=A0A3M2LNT5_9ACTN|nr:hypothetical protein EBO15_31115 [Actinomadura harenae]